MEEFETGKANADSANETETYVFRGRVLPNSLVGVVRRMILVVFLGPGVFVTLWLIGRILRR